MTVLLWAVPDGDPDVPYDTYWNAFTFTWTSPDGETINLRDPLHGRIILAEGILGLHHPPFESFTSRSPNSSIQRVHSTRSGPREIEWPMHLWTNYDSAEFLANDKTFWDLFSPLRYGTWTVQAPNGAARTIQARLISDGDYVYGRDPAFAGWATYPVNLMADDPFWKAESVVRSWANNPAEAFFDPAGSPPFHISQDAGFNAASLENPGDVPVWPVWKLYGPITSLDIEVDGGLLGFGSVASGHTLVIDTDPRVGTAILNGTSDVSGTVDPWDPRPIPAKSSVALAFTMAGAGMVEVDITPRYFRAF